MRNRINRITSKIALALIIVGLIAGLTLSRRNTVASASVHLTNRPPDAPPALQGEAAIRSLKEQGLYDSLQNAVTAARYGVRWEAAPPARRAVQPAYHAPNPAQRFDAYFTPNGLTLAASRAARDDVESAANPDEKAETPDWQVTMRLIGYGYGEALLTAGSAELQANDNQVDYRRPGSVFAEWYVNKPAGLEQGFTLEAAPGRQVAGEWLRLALELTGDLHAEMADEGQTIALKRADGEVALNYSNLYAYDAKGRELPSRMKAGDGQVWLEVDDAEAAYPVTIDPTFVQQEKLLAYDGAAEDRFGSSVAVSVDTAVVGAPGDDVVVYPQPSANTDQGSAYVFVRNGTIWSLQAKLVASDGSVGDNFGYSVAIDGNTIVIGAKGDTMPANWSPGSESQGSAYVFVRNGTNWSQQTKLVASDGAAGDRFGSTVAINIDTIVIGAPYDDINGLDQGSVHIFTRSYNSWWWRQKLTANDGTAGDYFGSSVAIAGEKMIVGAPYDDIGYNQNQGSAYILGYDTWMGAWFESQKLTASDGAAYDSFGFSVAINGNTAVIGAPADWINSYWSQGSAYVFVDNNWIWSQQAKLVANDGGAGDFFGGSVAIFGSTAVIGAHWDDVDYTQQGSVYVFTRTYIQSVAPGITDPLVAKTKVAWSQQQKLASSYGEFGSSVAISGGQTTTVVCWRAVQLCRLELGVLAEKTRLSVCLRR